jgi:hypothetical protein
MLANRLDRVACRREHVHRKNMIIQRSGHVIHPFGRLLLDAALVMLFDVLRSASSEAVWVVR